LIFYSIYYIIKIKAIFNRRRASKRRKEVRKVDQKTADMLRMLKRAAESRTCIIENQISGGALHAEDALEAVFAIKFSEHLCTLIDYCFDMDEQAQAYPEEQGRE
jgi:hypothetical protein